MAITSYGALKASQFMLMAFSVGMCFFPWKFMEGYNTKAFAGEAKTMMEFIMGIFGMTLLALSIVCASVARSESKAARSVGCLCMGATWAYFAANDFYLLQTGVFDAVVTDTGPIIGNLVLFVVFAGVSFAGWKESGSATPKFDKMVPKGRPKNAMLAGAINNAFFGIGLTFATRAFMEMYMPGLLDRLPGPGKRGAGEAVCIPMLVAMMGNAGKTILCATVSTLAICSVGDEDVSYKQLRGWSLHAMFCLGSFAREGILVAAADWPMPMRAVSFLQLFPVSFYMVNSAMGIPYSLKMKNAVN